MDKKKLTQEELNALSPRARKAYEGDEVISEILTENPNKEEPTIFEIDKEIVTYSCKEEALESGWLHG